MVTASEITGLSSAEVAVLRKQEEKYAIPLRSNRTYIQIFKENVFGIYNVVLICSAVLVLLLRGSKDVLFAVGLLVANIGIGLFQEIRAKRTLDKLAMVYTRTVHARRDGQAQTVALEDIVTGDIIELFPGEPVVVDGTLLLSDSLEMDESSLTGESESVAKQQGAFLTSGSYCLAGFGLLRAEKVGKKSSLYELTQKAKNFRASQTQSERWLKKLFQLLLAAILLFAPLTFINGINQGLALPETLSNVVNLVSSLVPQGLIMSMTLLFTYGVISISRYKTLVQRLNVIAVMGTVTVLCADKTGTLTTNQLSVKEIISLDKEDQKNVQRDLDIFTQHVSWANKSIQAIQAFFISTLSDTQRQQNSVKSKICEVPFSSERKWAGVSIGKESFILGAPEVLSTDKQVLSLAEGEASRGYRVLAFAKSLGVLNKEGHLPQKLQILALVILKDPLRTDVQETFRELQKQHIVLKIISGDSVATLRSVAGQLHLPLTEIVDQAELETTTAETFATKVRQGQIFARISPSMKEKILTELIRQGEYVAMVGDGVNDVRALKKSHVAIAVNEATQVTKDVADIILLENTFSALPKAIAEGKDITQRVYAIAKIFFVKVIYLLTLFLLAGFAGFEFPISLRQTTWLGFIVIGVPTALIAFKVLQPMPTRSLQKDLLRYTLATGVIGGLFMALLMIIEQIVLQEDLGTSRTQLSIFAALFSTLVLFQVMGIDPFSWKSLKKNWQSACILGLIGAVAILLPSEVIPALFQFTPLENIDLLVLAFGIAGCAVLLRFILEKIHFFDVLHKILYQ